MSKNKIDEELEKAAELECNGENIVKRQFFKSGAIFGAKFQEERMRADVQRMIEANKDIISWLKRMSHLHWGDPEYAPNFKLSALKLEEAIKEFK